MKMRRFVALLLCLSVLMTAGSALGDISFQDDDGNELTGRQLAMLAFEPSLMSQMYSASLTLLTKDYDAETVAILQEYYSIMPITNDDGSPAEVTLGDFSYTGFRDVQDAFSLLFYTGNAVDVPDHFLIQSKYSPDDGIVIPLAAALHALDLLSGDTEIPDWYFSAQSGDSYENEFYDIIYNDEANMDMLMVFARDNAAEEDEDQEELFEETAGLGDLYVWDDLLIYAKNDRAASIFGTFGGYEYSGDGILEIPAELSGLPVVRIGRQAFSGNDDFIRVTVPSSVRRIREGAFDDMSVLTEVVLADGVERLEKTFRNCPKLTNVRIPASVTSIDEEAFWGLDPYFHLTVERGSYADEYARARGITCLYIGEEGGSIALEPGNIVTFGSYDNAPLEWIVLKVQDGEAMLLTRDVLNEQAYSPRAATVWAGSFTKRILNEETIYRLFDVREADILSTHVISDLASPYSVTGIPGDASTCQLFLLSYFEARDLLPTDEARSASMDWWLRTARGYGSEYVHYVSADGAVCDGKDSESSLGIRPAIWVRTDRAEGIISVIDDATWPEVREEDDDEFGVGSTIQFGSYEQDNDNTNGKEALTWQVLSINGSSATLITKYCIDVRQYHSGSEAVNWGESSLRNWLNGDFFNIAFTPEEQSAMLQTSVENFDTDTASKTYMPSYMIDPVVSNDMVWILDYDEAQGYLPGIEDKLAYATKYASAKRVSTNNEGYAHWMLRTDKNDRCRINIMLPYQGGVSVSASSTDVAIRPVIRVDLAALGVMEENAEDTVPDWNRPYTTIVSQGKSNAANGTVLSSGLLGKVLQVENEVGGWFRLIAPSDGDYNFSVLAPDLSRDSFIMEISVSDEKRASLCFEKSGEVQTLTLPGIKAGEVITWWDNDNSGRWWTMLDPYKLMITIGDPADVPEAPMPAVVEESTTVFTNLADGDSIETGRDFTLEWNPVDGAGVYYINLYRIGESGEELAFSMDVWETQGHAVPIPASVLTDARYRVEMSAWIGSGGHNDEELFHASVEFSAEGESEIRLGFITPQDGETIQAGQKLEVEWTPIPGAKCYSLSANIPATNGSMDDWSEFFYNGETSCMIPRSTLIAPSYELELKAWKDDNRKRGQELFSQTIEIKVHDKFSGE